MLQQQADGTVVLTGGVQTATVSQPRSIAPGQLYVGAAVKATGPVYGSNNGESPSAQLSGLIGTVSRIVTEDPLTPYPVMLRDNQGNFVGWVKAEDCQVVNTNGI